MEKITLHHEILTQFRKQLHQHPEPSGHEILTAKRIVDFVSQYKPDEIITELGGCGVAVIFNRHADGKSILFRCELDALPISEINDFDHRSTNAWISHKCGHDGHMAILCGLAAKIATDRSKLGKIILLFQPAEEDGTGARRVFDDPRFQALQPDYVFALHNLPGYPKKQVVIRNGTFSAAVNSMVIQLYGKTAHAAEPHNGANPAQAIAEIIKAFDDLNQREISNPDFLLITPVHIIMGEKAYGVSAGHGELHFTIRSNNNQRMDRIERLLQDKAAEIAASYKLAISIGWTQPFRANENADEAVDMILAAAISQQLEVVHKPQPFSWGEDFGLLTEHYTGAMFGMGAGIDTPALHNPDYDYPDDITDAGIAVFYQIIQDLYHAQ